MKLAKALSWMCALALAACAAVPPPSSAAPEPAPILGTRWVGIVGEGVDPHALPRLEFVSGQRFSGYTGCNLFSGAWEMQGADVRVGGLVMTKRLCLGAAGHVEKRFLAALGPGARGRREGERLVFTGPKGERFAFAPASAS